MTITTEQRCLKMLTDRGLWPQEASAVLESAKPFIEVGGYRMTWGRPADEYPNVLYAAVMLILQGEAIKWIDENKPKHFARPMFLSSTERDALLSAP